MTFPISGGDDTSAILPPSQLPRRSYDFSNTNLDRFLKLTTPVISAMQFRQTINGRGTNEGELQQHFSLKNLWKAYARPSEFALEVPVCLNETEFIIQHYTPYLSGIQLFLDPSVPPPRTSEEIVANKTVNGSDSNEGARGSAAGVLVFEFLAKSDHPRDRAPFFGKIVELAKEFPELLTYTSHDLSPASWFSVAWYPMYTIPPIDDPDEVDSIFLTFHTLSTLPRGGQNEWIIPFNSPPKGVPCEQIPGELNIGMKMSLPTFGLATCKMIPSFWEDAAVGGDSKTSTLLRVAKGWLEKLNVRLPDYLYFASLP